MSEFGDELRLLESSEKILAQSFRNVAKRHAVQPDLQPILNMMAEWSDRHVKLLQPLNRRYRGGAVLSARLFAGVLFKGPRKGSIGLLRDLQDLAAIAHSVHGYWTVADQLAASLRDRELKALCDAEISQTLRQIEWIDSRIKELAPQALAVSS